MTKASHVSNFNKKFCREDCIMTENATNNPHNQANWRNFMSIFAHTIEIVKMVVLCRNLRSVKDDISCSALAGCPGMNFPIFTNYVTMQWLIRGTRVTCHV